MKVWDTALPGVRIIEPRVFGDARGFFLETFSEERYREEAGITLPFVQDNHSRSRQHVLRGLHFQRSRPQGKLVSVVRGAVYDVAVDVNPDSPYFGKYVGVTLSEDNHHQLWIPPGYAHGFCVLTEVVDFTYKCTDIYLPEDEGGLAWDCPEVAIAWPTSTPQLSEKDKHYPTLSELAAQGPCQA